MGHKLCDIFEGKCENRNWEAPTLIILDRIKLLDYTFFLSFKGGFWMNCVFILGYLLKHGTPMYFVQQLFCT